LVIHYRYHNGIEKKNIFYCYYLLLLANWQISFNRQNMIPNEMSSLNENEM
jgi:hypothetical protein